jgi:hypothetical protein
MTMSEREEMVRKLGGMTHLRHFDKRLEWKQEVGESYKENVERARDFVERVPQAQAVVDCVREMAQYLKGQGYELHVTSEVVLVMLPTKNQPHTITRRAI